MKFLLIFTAAFIAFGCRPKEIDQTFPTFQATDSDWATYEGSIMTEDGKPIEVEISLKEAPVGLESFYRLSAIHSDEESGSSVVIQGKYKVTSGLGNQSFGIELPVDETNGKVAGLSYFKTNSRSIKGQLASFTLTDLYFSTNGNSQLIQTDDDFNPITKDARYIVYKRSRLFTVEGYVTINSNDSSEFFERNTHEKWELAPLGEYQKSKKVIPKLQPKQMKVYIFGHLHTLLPTSIMTTSTMKNLCSRRL